jgi:hypothetical protein
LPHVLSLVALVWAVDGGCQARLRPLLWLLRTSLEQRYT